MLKAYEANMQEIHSLQGKVSILKHDLSDTSELNEKLKEEIGETLIKSEKLKKSNVTLQTKSDNLLLQNENLKCTIKTLKKENEQMVTIKQMEQLLDTKLAKLENRIVKGLVNPIGITPHVATKQATNIVIEEHDSTASARSSSPVKSFHDECTNLQLNKYMIYIIIY
ncbi:uncharacterized protein LOC126553652 [Aphis gossypii]|uniref:uncharacterized protein LOC126553652 n=1 Tax=Aphis gossypii TaxID=80765 RepID=UPI002158F139|nr:uncharacterized protein LOC126553652 [Aphis gossypii]